MAKTKKAVYYICDNHDWGYVSYHVWDILKEEGYLNNKVDFTFDGREVFKYTDKNNNEFYFVPTEIAICRDYPRYLSDMNRYFSDFDMSGMVTWHEGTNALSRVITVHSIGDVNSGIYGPANPQYMHNLMWAIERLRKEAGLDFSVVTEATHWSGVYEGDGNPELILKYPVPMIDIEIGSEPESWSNMDACRVLALSLLHIFDEDGIKLHNLLCMGGVHFDPGFAEAVHATWNDGKDSFGISHIIANQWLVSGEYEGEKGIERACDCVDAIIGGIEGIVVHDKLKGCYKDVARALGEKYKVPVFKHQTLRKPETIKWQ